MSDSDDQSRRYRTSTLWALALGIVVADAAIFWVGLTYGLIGIVVSICIILWTQRKADAYWRAHNAVRTEHAA